MELIFDAKAVEKYADDLAEIDRRARDLDGNMDKITPEMMKKEDAENAYPEIYTREIRHLTDEEMKEMQDIFGGDW